MLEKTGLIYFTDCYFVFCNCYNFIDTLKTLERKMVATINANKEEENIILQFKAFNTFRIIPIEAVISACLNVLIC